MKLGIHERLLVLSVLPKEGSIVTLRVTRDLVKNVGLSEAEIKEFEIKQNENGSVSWNPAKAKDKEIAIGDTAKGVIAKALKALNDSNKLPMEYIDVYDKFVSE